MLTLTTPDFAALKNLTAPLVAVLACLALSGPALAAGSGSEPDPAAKQAEKQAEKQAQAQRKEARAEIAARRAVIEQRRTAIESGCYQRFAVEDCLKQAREDAREQDRPLRERELKINDEERKERAAQRLEDIEAKKSQKAASAMEGKERVPADRRDTQATRAQDAQQRAAQQASRQRAHEAQVEQRQSAQEQERRAASQAQFEAKQQQAAERKARAAEAARERGPQAAPLPAPTAP